MVIFTNSSLETLQIDPTKQGNKKSQDRRKEATKQDYFSFSHNAEQKTCNSRIVEYESDFNTANRTKVVNCNKFVA